MHDPYVLELGWYIDDIEITGPDISFFDDVESGPGAWTVNNGWYITDGIITYDNDHTVNFIQHIEINLPNNPPYEETTVTSMNIDDATEFGKILLPMINMKFIKYDAPVMVIAAQPGFEHTFATSYLFFYEKEPMPWSNEDQFGNRLYNLFQAPFFGHTRIDISKSHMI